MAFLLAIAAFTGSIQAFYYEIDEWLNPDFYQTNTSGPLLPATELIDRLESTVPGAEVWYQQAPAATGRSSMLAVSPSWDEKNQQYAQLENNYFYMDPVSGEIIGARMWGKCCFEAENLLNYLYELHHSLTLPGNIGFSIMGIVACAWTLACLTMLYSAIINKKGLPSIGLSLPTTVLLAILMLPVAVSSIAMNFSQQLFKPVVSLFSPVAASIYEQYGEHTIADYGKRKLSYQDAYQMATQLGQQRGWTQPIGELFYSHSYNFYGMAFGLRDPAGMGNNWLYLSAENGAVVGEKTPTAGSAGDLFYYAQLPLHSGRSHGFISQLFIFIVGLITTGLSIMVIIKVMNKAVWQKQAINTHKAKT
ncbi:PepSY domain-containing protein [Dasania sp. GY-MA-18]|uniref:PepSY-associated TM helix domain-containing protein n=1 Tax=Dasania phycosphaerae TaxID=2950436 RepID=A0A9J6RJW5_9GAMM|nr:MULTISPECIES: PepSY-associated TM helix domain-containing protein [Dasania]MCR8921849.1 PepSY domain-containing protein [Dasania sp. GY-MA-18]MCZ0864277.1 PepSY-associated TM helix domain-containing protein [Dasania phycosphaerae]MCZ0868005.1 PepSY-associated TM helix domain-containing protein [Dasania phycosphaerae]